MSKPRNPDIELKVEWNKKEDDIMIHYPKKCDGHFAYGMFSCRQFESRFLDAAKRDKEDVIGPQSWNKYMCIVEVSSFIKQLESRGYDIKTLKFSIKKKEIDDE